MYGTGTVPYRYFTVRYEPDSRIYARYRTVRYGTVPYGNVPYDTVRPYVFLRMNFVRLFNNQKNRFKVHVPYGTVPYGTGTVPYM